MAKNIKKCPECKGILEKKNCIESAHAFYLGTKYSQAMGANFRDKDGKQKPIVMGCYGIGIGRLMATIVEVWHDEKGIIWPKEAAPFQVHLIQIPSPAESRAKVKKRTKSSSPENRPKIKKTAEKLYTDLQKAGIEVLYDDREDKSAGEKLVDADLIGIPLRIVISERTLKRSSIEVKERKKKEAKFVKIGHLSQFLNF